MSNPLEVAFGNERVGEIRVKNIDDILEAMCEIHQSLENHVLQGYEVVIEVWKRAKPSYIAGENY